MRLFALSFLLLLSACANKPFIPERPHPTEERIRELARIDTPIMLEKTPIRIFMTPAMAMAGNAVRLTCIFPSIPDDRYAQYTFGITDTVIKQGTVEFREISTIVNIACEPQTAFCTVEEKESGIVRKTHTTNLAFEAIAGCGSSK